MPREHIDVINDFTYDSENARYNRDYRNWRRHTEASCIFRHVQNSAERVYVAGKSAARQNTAVAERAALLRAAESIGAALMICLFCELVGGTLLIWCFRQLGFDIRLDFLTLSMNGIQWAVTAVRMLVLLLKYGLPIILLMRRCRLPMRVTAPLSFRTVPESIAAAGGGMLCAAVYSLAGNSLGVEMAQRIFTYKDTVAVFCGALFEVLFGAVLAELLLRGTILPVLRQFGDRFALVLTAFAAFLFPNGIAGRIGELLVGLGAGYLLIRGGSIHNCILLRVVYTTLTYARLILVYSGHNLTLLQFVLILTGAGAASVMCFVLIRRKKIVLSNRRTSLPLSQKLLAFAQTFSTLPWLAASALVTIMQLFY